jgi:hypothetical protein
MFTQSKTLSSPLNGVLLEAKLEDFDKSSMLWLVISLIGGDGQTIKRLFSRRTAMSVQEGKIRGGDLQRYLKHMVKHLGLLHLRGGSLNEKTVFESIAFWERQECGFPVSNKNSLPNIVAEADAQLFSFANSQSIQDAAAPTPVRAPASSMRNADETPLQRQSAPSMDVSPQLLKEAHRASSKSNNWWEALGGDDADGMEYPD